MSDEEIVIKGFKTKNQGIVKIDLDSCSNKHEKVYTNYELYPEWEEIPSNQHKQIDLEAYLPDMEYNYEVIFELIGEHQGRDFNFIKLYASSDYIITNFRLSDDFYCIVNSQKPSTYSSMPTPQYLSHFTLQVGIDRYIEIYNICDDDAYIKLKMLGYRRI